MKYASIVVGVLACLCFGFGCSSSDVNQSSGKITSYELRTELVGMDANGREVATGVQAESAGWPSSSLSPIILASPDTQRVLLGYWNTDKFGIEFAIENINGSDRHVVANQSMPEGQGSLNLLQTFWLDDETITYEEVGSDGEDSDAVTVFCHRLHLDTGKNDLVTQHGTPSNVPTCSW